MRWDFTHFYSTVSFVRFFAFLYTLNGNITNGRCKRITPTTTAATRKKTPRKFYFIFICWTCEKRISGLKKLTRPQHHSAHTHNTHHLSNCAGEFQLKLKYWRLSECTFHPFTPTRLPCWEWDEEKNGFLSITNCCGITFQTFHICALKLNVLWCRRCCWLFAGTILITLYTPSLYSGYTLF